MKIETTFARYALIGLLMLAVMAGATPVWAQDINATIERLVNRELTNIPDLISAVFYIGGAAYMGAGLLKIKQHIDNPGQTKLGEGVGRLAVGAGLLALPAVSNMIINTFGWNGGVAIPYTGFDAVQ